MIINRCFVNETLEKLLKDGWHCVKPGSVACIFPIGIPIRRSTQN